MFEFEIERNKQGFHFGNLTKPIEFNFTKRHEDNEGENLLESELNTQSKLQKTGEVEGFIA